MSKGEFFKKEIEYLGHLVSGEGTSPMKQKLKQLLIWPLQQTSLKLNELTMK